MGSLSSATHLSQLAAALPSEEQNTILSFKEFTGPSWSTPQVAVDSFRLDEAAFKALVARGLMTFIPEGRLVELTSQGREVAALLPK